MRPVLLPLFLLPFGTLFGQNTIAFQGFESGAACPNWDYSGGVVNTATARSGTQSLRVGRNGENTTATFSPVTVSGYFNVQLSLYHSVLGGSGPGMDTDEGATMQVRLNGGGWTTIGSVGGYSNYAWGWNSTGGTTAGQCGTTCPNPLLYNVPNGTATVEIRVYSNACPSGATSSYDRTDEGFYIDDLKLTTTSAVTTPGTGSVTWTGTHGTDWFDCRNWNPAVLPGPGWSVTIDQTAVNNCIVGNSASSPSAAYCSTLHLTSTGATRKLTIDNGRELKVTGMSTVQRSGATPDSVVLLVNNGIFEGGGLTVGGPGAVFRNNVTANTAQVKGNVLLSPNGKIDITNGILGVEGDLTNNASTALFLRINSEVVLNGSTAQGVHANGFTDDYATLRVVKEAGDVTLFTPITVSGTLDLYLGRVFTDAVNILTLKPNSQIIDASNGSFIHGPLSKQGNGSFTFPVGKGSFLRPISITGNASGTGTFSLNIPNNAYTAEYFHESPRDLIGTPLATTLDHISDCEYWTLDRTGTIASTPYVRVSWSDPVSCGVDQLSDLRVAHWDGSLWNDQGNSGTTGNASSGTVTTQTAQSSFSPWTLASVNAFNPLPIELLSFTAQGEGDRVRLDWTTMSEAGNDHFDIERSADDLVFSSIARIPGAGNSQTRLDYRHFDPEPLAGSSYYRLRQTDLNGASSLSNVVPVHFTAHRSSHHLTLIASYEGLIVHHDLGDGSYTVHDVTGRVWGTGSAGANSFTVPIQDLPRGIYLLRVTTAFGSASERFLH